MKTAFICAATLTLAGCNGLPLGTATIHSNPVANAMRTCAALTDVVTPGISPMAAYEITKNALGDVLALGNTPAAALRNCAQMIDSIED